MAVVLITHNLGVVARMADDVAVMYAGEIVEKGSAEDIFYRASHPYTLGLQAAMPSSDPKREQGLQPIEGTPPDMFDPPKGCAYYARCPYAMRLCAQNHPERSPLNAHHYAQLLAPPRQRSARGSRRTSSVASRHERGDRGAERDQTLRGWSKAGGACGR